MELVQAFQEFDQAKQKLHAAVKKHLPVGTIVEIQRQRGTSSFSISATVTGYAQDWMEPGRVHYTNNATGKKGHFYPNHDQFSVVLPAGVPGKVQRGAR